MTTTYDVIIIGAGAAGLMCALTAGNRGKRVLVVDHANKAGKKILMSGGGRCNFTNYYIENDCYLSKNPHFFKSALARYTQWDFISLVEKHGIPFHEKTLGQLFCQTSSKDILNMLLKECGNAHVEISLKTSITKIKQHAENQSYALESSNGSLITRSLVIATGGLSIPTMGATGFGYQIAQQFGLTTLPTRAGLVPFTMPEKWLENYSTLSGISVDAIVTCGDKSFRENILFTHRGISGPAILQISSYWQLGEVISINFFPDTDAKDWLNQNTQQNPNAQLSTILAKKFSKKFANKIAEEWFNNKPLKQYAHKELEEIAKRLENWVIKPHGTEGYRTAEVTLGGVDVDQISSKTMEAKSVPGLYFIGEVLDVTGHLGGFNFQWAWASGVAAGESV